MNEWTISNCVRNVDRRIKHLWAFGWRLLEGKGPKMCVSVCLSVWPPPVTRLINTHPGPPDHGPGLMVELLAWPLSPELAGSRMLLFWAVLATVSLCVFLRVVSAHCFLSRHVYVVLIILEAPAQKEVECVVSDEGGVKFQSRSKVRFGILGSEQMCLCGALEMSIIICLKPNYVQCKQEIIIITADKV